jgi:DtxR family Mn-dependent transcriptional regulator
MSQDWIWIASIVLALSAFALWLRLGLLAQFRQMRASQKRAQLEDEPASLFAQIAAMGLRPGQMVQVLEANEQRVVLSDGEVTHSLAPIVAANIFVAPDGTPRPANLKRLSALKPGQQATVQTLTESLQGFTRRRLLDLGLTPGVGITAELPSLFRDPVAYRVRGALIALRRDQAEQVLVTIHS